MTTSAQVATRPDAAHRLSSVIATVVVPAVVTAATTLVALSWRDDLPDPVATHFAPDGPDGFGSLTGLVVATSAGSLVLAVTMGVVALRLGREALTRRVAAATAVGVSTFLGALTLGMLALQRGLESAELTPDIDPAITVALLVGIAAAALAGWTVPGDGPRPATGAVPDDVTRIPLSPHERAVWVQRTSSRLPWVVGLGVLVPLVVLTALLREPYLLLVPALALAPLVTTLQFTVTVDDTGLVARSLLGFPRLTVPLDEVVRAEEVAVAPLRDFGGWGVRVGRHGRTGIVLRAGSALQVERTGGRVLVVTVDDAATGAALLNSLAARRR